MFAIIDGAAVEDRAALHTLLFEQLALPEWYGHNLDALYDVLSTTFTEATLIFLHGDAAQERLGGYLRTLRGMLADVGEENPYLHILWKEGEQDCEM